MRLIEWEVDEDWHPLKSKKERENGHTDPRRIDC